MRSRDDEGMPAATTPPLFREVQRFHQWFFWVPLLVVTVLVWYEFVQQVVLSNPQGSQPLPDWAAWLLAIVFGFGFPIFGAMVRLVTEVRPGDLTLRLMPFKGRHIALRDIAEAQAREYSPMREFGGWGVRVGRSGKAYTAHGEKGIQLSLKDGSAILVGSQRPDELVSALKAAGAKIG